MLMSRLARLSVPGTAERFERAVITPDQRLLFGPGPTFELALPLDGHNQRNRSFTMHQTGLLMVMGMLTAKTQAMLAQAFGQVVRLADVERTVG